LKPVSTRGIHELRYKSAGTAEKYPGKPEMRNKVALKNREDLSCFYTPGVAAPYGEIARFSEKVYEYTAKGNIVAMASDGSSVLGLKRPALQKKPINGIGTKICIDRSLRTSPVFK
jgi:malic enzyme